MDTANLTVFATVAYTLKTKERTTPCYLCSMFTAKEYNKTNHILTPGISGWVRPFEISGFDYYDR